MRSYEEYCEILTLWEEGESKKGIARVTDINRSTVRETIERFGSIEGLEQAFTERKTGTLEVKLHQNITDEALQQSDFHKAYAYLLGLYLGDGSIVKARKVYKLRVTLDEKYPNIINACIEAMQTLLPANRVGLAKKTGCVDVYVIYKNLPLIFPQHGDGPKHKRPIILEPWQERIVAAFPLEFLRGLYHSDGSRAANVVNGTDYPRYQFHNFSADIRRLFCEACDRLDLHWTLASGHNISIARRADVARLDGILGPKN